MTSYGAPAPPPKPGSHDSTRMSTPSAASSAPRPVSAIEGEYYRAPPPPPGPSSGPSSDTYPVPPTITAENLPDPGEGWLPQILQDKKQDLAEILASPELLTSLAHAPSSIHPSLLASHRSLTHALDENMTLAAHVMEVEAHLSHLRAATQADLLSTHALERQWRQKQADTDHALEPFAPASLYMRLGQGLAEQRSVCQALEESFLDAPEDGAVGERELGDWVRRYREARTLCYLRQERKERWDEGRVGGWR